MRHALCSYCDVCMSTAPCLQEPLLIPEAQQPPPTAAQGAFARRPPSVPVRRPALPQSIGSMPFLARSVRLFPHMFSPHSLASPPLDGAYHATLNDEELASSVNQRQRWPGTTPNLHSGGVLRPSDRHSSGTAAPAHSDVPSQHTLSRLDSDSSANEGV